MTNFDPDRRLRVALFGAGRVGTAVALLLARAGHQIVAVSSRSSESAERAKELLEAPVIAWGDPLEESIDLILLGVSDDALGAAVDVLRSSPLDGTLVCHLAGVVGTTPLEPLAIRGAKLAALHPVQACPTIEAAVERLPGSAWGVTCDAEVKQLAFHLVEADLHGTPVWVEEEARAVWHAAAVTVSNGIAALLAAGESMLTAIEIDEPEKVLGPLAMGTIANAVEGGGGGATLTGPVVRADLNTLERHTAGLERVDPTLRVMYQLFGVFIAEQAVRAGRISSEQRVAALEAIAR
jgi:predicted short-subunit dehydrogenase-like oxidoreductase (DUF2520 family)